MIQSYACSDGNAPKVKRPRLLHFIDFIEVSLLFEDQKVLILENNIFVMYLTILDLCRCSQKWSVFWENLIG